MNCTYCNDPADFALMGSTKVHCCARCRRLYVAAEWSELAAIWLVSRPQDWVGDVSAYLEVNARPAVFNKVKPGPYDVPADLVDMDETDWLN